MLPTSSLIMFSPAKEKITAKGLRIGIAVSRYHAEITDSMRDAAVEAFTKAGGHAAKLIIAPAPGTFELTAICHALVHLESDQDDPAPPPALDALVALGCVITGQTAHDEYIAQSVTQGLTALIVQTGVPIAFGILTCQNIEQARARSIEAAALGGANKGAEAMMAAIQTVNSIRMLKSSMKGVPQ